MGRLSNGVSMVGTAAKKPVVRTGRGTYRFSKAMLKLISIVAVWFSAIVMTPWTLGVSLLVATGISMLILG
jgi:hypothetical protein